MLYEVITVARGMGVCCVAGCGDVKLNEEKKHFTLGGSTIKEGDYISLNGSTGDIYAEAIKTVEAEVTGDFAELMGWADEIRTLKVRTNADTPRDAAQAVVFGAEGIGLCRTESYNFV